MTAAELMAELSRDPEQVSQRSAAERDLAAREDEYRMAEAPVINDLRKCGLEITSVWDLVNTSKLDGALQQHDATRDANLLHRLLCPQPQRLM